MKNSLSPALGSVRPLKIDIVVHGRFHAFALAQELFALGHDVRLLTNYPSNIVKNFGFPKDRVRSFVAHGIASRIVDRLGKVLPQEWRDRWMHTIFGNWASRNIRADADIVHGFSGIMEETLRLPRNNSLQIRSIVRGSSHIEEQYEILSAERKRAGVSIESPSDWMRAREQREYALANKIIVLSSFAAKSFHTRGFTDDKVCFVPLGVDLRQFQARGDDIKARRNRILSGDRLRVLNVGTLSYQKGAYDLFATASRLKELMQFRFVGTKLSEVNELIKSNKLVIEIKDRVPEIELKRQYDWADLFLFSSIQDGFAVVLTQAAAAGLPIIATTNCAAPDFIKDGETGWIVPIRDSDSLILRLLWCDQNREALSMMVDNLSKTSIDNRSWSDVAREFLLSIHKV